MKIVGSIIVGKKIRPFIFNDATLELIFDQYSWERAVLMNPFDEIELWGKIKKASTIEFSEIRIGKYFCDSCKNWQNATSQEWSYGMCLNCSLDRDSDFSENYD